MRRRNISSEELAKVIALRQGNASWLKIQRDTGVPRRVAQRAYEQWGRGQAREELKAARKEVAAEEFRSHLLCLVKLAQSLVDTLYIPQPTSHPTMAKEVLLHLWQSDIVGEFGAYGPPGIKQKPETYLRQNQMLLKSLKVHTREKDWLALEQWGEAFDTCNTILSRLREKTGQTLSNILKRDPKLAERIMKGCRNRDVVERMADGVLHVVWQNILSGRDASNLLIQAIKRVDGVSEVLFGDGRLNVGLIFSEEKLAAQVVDVGMWVVNNLGIERQQDMAELADEIGIMRKAIDNLTEMLNSITLRPQILRTQCDLCPA